MSPSPCKEYMISYDDFIKMKWVKCLICGWAKHSHKQWYTKYNNTYRPHFSRST